MFLLIFIALGLRKPVRTRSRAPDWCRFEVDSRYYRPAMFRRLTFVVFALVFSAIGIAATPELLLVAVGDQHSAYDRYAQFVARIDRIKADNPGVPLAMLIDGDAFEAGNAVAKRTGGAIDFALLAALVKRGPVVFNIGNHDTDLMSMPEVVQRLRAGGVTVICGNIRDRASGQAFAPAVTQLKLGSHMLTVVGVTTDNLATFRAAVRADLNIENPVRWAHRTMPALLDRVEVPVVLSHAGVRADREMLSLVPDGTLFAGAHDHLQFIHRTDRTVYFQSGSWQDCMTLAELDHTSGRARWTVQQLPINGTDPADPTLAALIDATLRKTLTADEKTVVGHTIQSLTPAEAARFAVEAVRRAASADVCVIGGTTFGAGLPAGNVSRYAFDAWVRFDGTLSAGELDGAHLQRILVRANQRADTPLEQRTGEILIAAGPDRIDPARKYRLVTTDWIARDPKRFLGDDAPPLSAVPGLHLKAIVLDALNH